METELIAGIILMVVGMLFFFNNKNIGKGASKLYQKFYTQKNLTIIFRIIGIILVFAGLVLIFVK